MHTHSHCRFLTACILTIASLALTGCPPEDEKKPAATPDAAAPTAGKPSGTNAGWEGKYYNAADKMIIELKPNHVATVTEEGDPNVANMTWEMHSPEKATIHMIGDSKLDVFRNADGSLRDTQGGVWAKK